MVRAKRRAAPEFSFRLNGESGVPVYRQLIDQVHAATARGALIVGDQLPTVRQVAVDLAINPNTVLRAYREMEIRGTLETHQGSGTFIAMKAVKRTQEEHARQLAELVAEFIGRAGQHGFTVQDLTKALREISAETGP